MLQHEAPLRVLIADDDNVLRRCLTVDLERAGYAVTAFDNGGDALHALLAPDAPPIALLDWMMPGHTGLEICRRVRAEHLPRPTYLMLLTGRENKGDLVTGLNAGADDFLKKPYEPEEVLAHLRVAERQLRLEAGLRSKVAELQASTRTVRELEELIPICMCCRRVRVEDDHWERIEAYLERRGHGVVSHGLCAECLDRNFSVR